MSSSGVIGKAARSLAGKTRRCLTLRDGEDATLRRRTWPSRSTKISSLSCRSSTGNSSMLPMSAGDVAYGSHAVDAPPLRLASTGIALLKQSWVATAPIGKDGGLAPMDGTEMKQMLSNQISGGASTRTCRGGTT